MTYRGAPSSVAPADVYLLKEHVHHRHDVHSTAQNHRTACRIMHACSAWRGSFHEKDDHHNRADQRVRTKKNPAPTRSQTASAVVLSPGRLYVVKKVVILSNFSFRSLPGLRKHPVLYSCSSEPNPTVSGLIFLGSTIFFLSG